MIKVYIAGHTGMVDHQLQESYHQLKNLRLLRQRSQLNLLNYRNTFRFIKK